MCHTFNSIAKSKTIQSQIDLSGRWPSGDFVTIFQEAASHGNVAAAIKLGVAVLYGEGIPLQPIHAAETLMLAEQLVGCSQPFSWMLIRSPWSSEACSKAVIFKSMQNAIKETCISNDNAGITYSVAKVSLHLNLQQILPETQRLLIAAASYGCTDAVAELYHHSQRLQDPSLIAMSRQFLQLHSNCQNANLLYALACDSISQVVFIKNYLLT